MAQSHKRPDANKWCDLNLMNIMYSSFAQNGQTYQVQTDYENIIDKLATDDLAAAVQATKVHIADKQSINENLKPFTETNTLIALKLKSSSRFLLHQNLGKTLQILLNSDITKCNYTLKPEEFSCVIFESPFFTQLNFSLFRIVTESRAIFGLNHLPQSVTDSFSVKTNAFKIIQTYPPSDNRLFVLDTSTKYVNEESAILRSKYYLHVLLYEVKVLLALGYQILLVVVCENDSPSASNLDYFTRLANYLSIGNVLIGNFFYINILNY